MRKKPATAAGRRPADDGPSLLVYLSGACADEPELCATVATLAEADEIDLLRLVRDFRDNLSDSDILARHGPADSLSEKLRVIHRVYVDCARRVREELGRPVRARKCYEARMLARRDNYKAMLADPDVVIDPEERHSYEQLVECAREKVLYEALPARLGRDASVVQEEVLKLRQLFKDWAARRKSL
jgi:hypothetical protein